MKIAKFISGIIALVAGVLSFILVRKEDEVVLGLLVLSIAAILCFLVSVILQKKCDLKINKGFRIANMAIGGFILLIAFLFKRNMYEIILMCDVFWGIPMGILFFTEIGRQDNGFSKALFAILGVVIFGVIVIFFADLVKSGSRIEKFLDYGFYALYAVVALNGFVDIIFSFVKGKEKTAVEEAVEAPVAEEVVAEEPVNEEPAVEETAKEAPAAEEVVEEAPAPEEKAE